MWDIPQGVLKFAINAGMVTLPSFDNLKRWGKRVSDRCPFCGNIQTLAHILSNCSISLDQGRYTWRHDLILKYIHSSLDNSKFQSYVDIENCQINGGTIPPHLPDTSLKLTNTAIS